MTAKSYTPVGSRSLRRGISFGLLTLVLIIVWSARSDQPRPIQGPDISCSYIPSSPSFRIAVVDSGIDPDHPLFEGRLEYDAGNLVGTDVVSGSSSVADLSGHGTHVAGIIAQLAPPEVKILPVLVTDPQGKVQPWAIAEGIRWGVDHGARIINVSLGVPEYDRDVAEAVQYAWRNASLVVAAGGNGGLGRQQYPAANIFAIGVNAVDESGRPLESTSPGSHVRVAARGADINSSTPTYQTLRSAAGLLKQDYDVLSGSSQATPVVSAQLAWLSSRCPGLANSELVALLEEGARGSGVWDSELGYGIVDYGVLHPKPNSQVGSVVGTLVLDEAAIADVKVKVGKQYVEVTPDGQFHAPNLPGGTYPIKILSSSKAIHLGDVLVQPGHDSFFWASLRETQSR